MHDEPRTSGLRAVKQVVASDSVEGMVGVHVAGGVCMLVAAWLAGSYGWDPTTTILGLAIPCAMPTVLASLRGWLNQDFGRVRAVCGTFLVWLLVGWTAAGTTNTLASIGAEPVHAASWAAERTEGDVWRCTNGQGTVLLVPDEAFLAISRARTAEQKSQKRIFDFGL